MFIQNTPLKLKQNYLQQRFVPLLGAALLVFALISMVLPGKAQAYSQVTHRSIELSSAQASATNVAYKVGFTTVTNNQTVGSVVVEFCANSPILGDTCSLTATPSTFLNINKSTLSVNNITGNIPGLTVDTTDSTQNRVVLVPTGGPLTNVANGAVSFTLGNGTTNGITNPADIATFYARIMTFTNSTGTDGGDENNNATDAGGIAISTANQLHVTAKVQEALLFCVYTATDCATGGSDVTLGDQNGVLASTTTTYTADANFDVSSNAVSGVSIRMQGSTLTSGAFTIDPATSVCETDPTSSATEMFGLRMLTLGTGVSAGANYGCATGQHTFDSDASTGIPSEFGEEIAKTSGATDVSGSTIEFAAKSANTSEAGVYTTTLNLIATATY